MLSFIIDEEVSIIHRFSQRAMRLPKLCKMEPCGGQDQLGIPDLLVFVSVTSIKIRTFTRARLCVGRQKKSFRSKKPAILEQRINLGVTNIAFYLNVSKQLGKDGLRVKSEREKKGACIAHIPQNRRVASKARSGNDTM